MHVDDHERTNKIPMDRPKKKSARRSLLGVEACRRYVAGAAACSAPSQIHSSSSATAGATGPAAGVSTDLRTCCPVVVCTVWIRDPRYVLAKVRTRPRQLLLLGQFQ